MRMRIIIMNTILMNKLLLTIMTVLLMVTATTTFGNGVNDGGTNHQDRISMATPTPQQQQQQNRQMPAGRPPSTLPPLPLLPSQDDEVVSMISIGNGTDRTTPMWIPRESFPRRLRLEADRELLELLEREVKARVIVLEITIREDNNISIVIKNNNTRNFLFSRQSFSIYCFIEEHTSNNSTTVELLRNNTEERDETRQDIISLLYGGRSYCATYPQR